MQMMCATRLIVLSGNSFTRGGRAASLTALASWACSAPTARLMDADQVRAAILSQRVVRAGDGLIYPASDGE